MDRSSSLYVSSSASVLFLHGIHRPYPRLCTIRSLAYFLPVIEEVLASHVSPEYFEYLRHKLARTAPPR